MIREPFIEILLVEDNPDDVDLALHALKRNNLANKVEIARDGEEALDFVYGDNLQSLDALSNRPRLVLLDLKLPKINGLEVLEKLKSDPRTRKIPVVVMTTSAEEPDVKRAYDLGANSYIVKPVNFEQFVEVVQQLGFYWLLVNKAPKD